MPRIVVDLRIAADDYLRMYAGTAKSVVARARDGRRVRFPAQALRAFVSHEGITGCFAVDFDENMKLLGISRLN